MGNYKINSFRFTFSNSSLYYLIFSLGSYKTKLFTVPIRLLTLSLECNSEILSLPPPHGISSCEGQQRSHYYLVQRSVFRILAWNTSCAGFSWLFFQLCKRFFSWLWRQCNLSFLPSHWRFLSVSLLLLVYLTASRVSPGITCPPLRRHERHGFHPRVGRFPREGKVLFLECSKCQSLGCFSSLSRLFL